MDKLSHQVTQNVHIKNKLNEANHDYQTLRRRAVLRRNDRLKRKSLELQAIDKRLLHDVGVESFRPKTSLAERVFHVTLSILLLAVLVLFVMMSLGI